MRRVTTAALTLLLACGEDESSGPAPRQTDQQSACTTAEAERFFVAATQVTYDYDPRSAAELVADVELVVRGKLVSIALGYDSPAGPDVEQHTVLFELLLDRTYKGGLSIGDRVFISQSRAPVVDAKVIEKLRKSLPKEDVTVFLNPADASIRRPPALPASTPLYVPYGPQGIVVSNACAAGQPLAEGPLFTDAPASSDALDTALRALVD